MTMSYLVKGIAFPTRLAAFLVLEGAGTVLLFLNPPWLALPGALLCLAGSALMLAKGYSTKPRELGVEEWLPVDDGEITRMVETERAIRTVKRPLYAKTGVRVLVALVLIVAFFMTAGSRSSRNLWFVSLASLVPYFFSGGFRVWRPATLGMKLETFRPFMESPVPPGLVRTPYLRLDKTPEGRRIPEDMRMTVEPKRKPTDFEAAQFQVAINDGPNGKVPYLYAVFLCKGEGPTYRALANRSEFPGYVVEAEASKDYSTVVVRQETGGTGYHTTYKDCERLYRAVSGRLLAM
jgi:hypothetical protein